MFYYQIRMTWNLGGRGVMQNTFTIRYGGTVAVTDAAVLTQMQNWMNLVYGASGLTSVMSNTVTFLSGIVTEHTVAGALIRELGGISPSVNGSSAADILPGVDALSATARTNTPKVRGGKRFGGIVETVINNQLLNNTALSALVAAVSRWITPALGGINPWESGVFATSTGQFVPFNGTGIVKNIPGTQVTRKPGRGM